MRGRCSSEVVGHDELEECRGDELVAGHVLEDRDFDVAVDGELVVAEFDAGGEHETLVARGDGVGGVGAAVGGAFGADDLGDGDDLEVLDGEAVVVDAGGGVDLHSGAVIIADERGDIGGELEEGVPFLVGSEVHAVIAAEEEVGAAGAELGVAVGAVVGEVAGGEFDAEIDAEGLIVEETSVEAFEADVADGGPFGGGEVSAVLGAEVTACEGDLCFDAPTAGEEVLKADLEEVGADGLVAVLGGGALESPCQLRFWFW